MKIVLMTLILTLNLSSRAGAEEFVVRAPFSFLNFPSKDQVPILNLSLLDISIDQADALKRQGFLVEPNSRIHILEATQGRPEYSAAPFNWAVEAIRAPAAHGLESGRGEGVTVCVIDTGINADHPTLLNAISGGLNIQTGSTDLSDVKDDNGHGTAVSSLIAGRPYQNFIGVAPAAQIFAVKFFGNDGYGSYMDAIKAIVACESRTQVINMSWGSETENQALVDALHHAKSAGLALIAAAGYAGSIAFPARNPDVLAIGSLDEYLQIPDFGAFGPELDFVGPGTNVDVAALNGGFMRMSGTSFSSALASGVAAIQMSRQQSMMRGRDLGFPAEQQGQGIIDALLTAGGQ